MNVQKQLVLPALAAVSVLAIVAAASYVVAEPGYAGSDKHAWKDHKGHAVEVEGFVGSVPVQQIDRESIKELREQATVSLHEASAGLDVIKGSLKTAVNENGDRFLVWKLISVDRSDDSDTMTVTIHIVDAADASNTATVVKEFDRSAKDYKHYGKDMSALTEPEQIEKKIQMIERKLDEGMENAEMQQLKTDALSLLRQLQSAISDGDDAQADSLRDQLKELRNQMVDLKKFK